MNNLTSTRSSPRGSSFEVISGRTLVERREAKGSHGARHVKESAPAGWFLDVCP